MQILFHLMADTGCLPDKVVPQIPTNRMKGEDQETPRICTGHTLDDCLTGIGIPHFISSFLLSEIRQGRSVKHAADTMLLPFVGRVYCVEDMQILTIRAIKGIIKEPRSRGISGALYLQSAIAAVSIPPDSSFFPQ